MPRQVLNQPITLSARIFHMAFQEGKNKTIAGYDPGGTRLSDISGSLKLNTFVSTPCRTA
jgi:hypothetical protein